MGTAFNSPLLSDEEKAVVLQIVKLFEGMSHQKARELLCEATILVDTHARLVGLPTA